jgi:mannose-6-phosphate isomerase-like protein (cupin superfamily)
MSDAKNDFVTRQYMITPDLEFFHYKHKEIIDIGYHNHDFYEIYFFISGKVTYLIEGKSYKLKPGDILLINNRELHKPIIQQGQEYERVVIWVTPNFVKQNSTKECDLSLCFESSSKNKYNLMRPHSEMLGIM